MYYLVNVDCAFFGNSDGGIFQLLAMSSNPVEANVPRLFTTKRTSVRVHNLDDHQRAVELQTITCAGTE